MSIQQKDRLSNLINILKQKHELSVSEAAVLMNVSEMTIRRDFDLLKDQGVIDRVHGGAVLLDPNVSTSYRYILGEQFTKNTLEKNAIGIKAASLIQPNETIFLDSGTTTPFISKNITPNLPLTVLCYTFTCASAFYQRENTNFILAGGVFHRESNIFYSQESLDLVRNTRAEKAFISTGGFDHKMGLTTYFDYEAGIKREMINSARQIILVADSTKFGKISVNHFAEIEDFDIIITDDGLPDEYRKIISDQGIELIIASLQDGN